MAENTDQLESWLIARIDATMLTEKQVEVAARVYCGAMGQNPDEQVWGADERHPTMGVLKPRWRFAVPAVRQQAAMRVAITAALAVEEG